MHQTRKTVAVSVGAVLFLASAGAYADRGKIPFNRAEIYEPNQRAMIAWDGKEELLILSTDLAASKKTKALEVIPFSSEPKVKKADLEIFKRATEILNKKLDVRAMGAEEHGVGAAVKGRGSPAEPAGEVTFHERIGSHEVSVVRVLEPSGFISWVGSYMKTHGQSNPEIPGQLRKSVDEYLKDGFNWFVFDVVDLDVKPGTRDAVSYRFKSDSLYYPLRISRAAKGTTRIDLLVLTHGIFGAESFQGLPANRVGQGYVALLSGSELKTVSSEMAEFLGNPDEASVRVWRIKGPLSSFDKDLLVSHPLSE